MQVSFVNEAPVLYVVKVKNSQFCPLNPFFDDTFKAAVTDERCAENVVTMAYKVNPVSLCTFQEEPRTDH
jgi:hypothetical protein